MKCPKCSKEGHYEEGKYDYCFDHVPESYWKD